MKAEREINPEVRLERRRLKGRERARRFYAAHRTQILTYKRVHYDMRHARRNPEDGESVRKTPDSQELAKSISASVVFSSGDRDMKRMNVEQAAQFLGELAGTSVSVSTIRSWKRAGLLPYYRFKGMLLFDEADLRSFFEAHRVLPTVPGVGSTRMTM